MLPGLPRCCNYGRSQPIGGVGGRSQAGQGGRGRGGLAGVVLETGKGEKVDHVLTLLSPLDSSPNPQSPQNDKMILVIDQSEFQFPVGS